MKPFSRDRGFLEHLEFGVLAATLPSDLIDEILARTHRREMRVRRLPARLVVYYVVALGLFFGDAYDEVLRRLVGGLRAARAWSDTWAFPTTSSLSKARQRLGIEPVKQLFDEVCRPIGLLSTPGTYYRDWRVMALDGVVLDVPDTPANNERFSHTNSGRFPSAYPVIRVLSLTECGTHAVVGASLGTATDHEAALFEGITPYLEPDMLVLADRGLAGQKIFQELQRIKAAALLRVSSVSRLDPLEVLSDGSYLSVMLPHHIQSPVRVRVENAGGYATPAGRALLEAAGTLCRVIAYTIDTADGSKPEVIRLITTILDPDQAPAHELAALYHERWEIELTFREIERDQTGGTHVLRSRTPDMAVQELYGILIAHFTVRRLMHQATLNTALDPDRLSFIHSIKVIRRHVTGQADFSPPGTGQDPSSSPR